MTPHKNYCFAGEPAAACPGYFIKDVLPCVCGVNGNVVSALSQVAMPLIPVEDAAFEIHEIHLLPLSA